MITVRERPPLRLALDIVSPGGRHSRWGRDEHDPSNAPSGLAFSSTCPGGFEQLSCVLPRKPGFDYPDLAEFSTITAYGAGGQVAWQGRLQTSPRTSGDQIAITPGAVGWQAALEDNHTARMIYLDCDFTHWQAASAQRRAELGMLDVSDPSVLMDSTTAALDVGFDSPWSRKHLAEAWYDGNGVFLGALFYAWKLNGNMASDDTNWTWDAALSTGDQLVVGDASGNLRAAGPGTGVVWATDDDRAWSVVQTQYEIAATSTSGIHAAVLWTYLGVVGSHSLPVQGTLTAAGGLGLLASDIIRHAVSTWAPQLASSFNGGISSIEASTFGIPQAVYPDFTTAGTIIQDVLKYEQQDWWVDEGGSNRSPTFNLCSPANHGRDWRARVGPSGLQETGPSVDRLWNQVVVSYRDVDGSTRTVGPAGSGADTTDASLIDASSANAVTAAGLERVYAYPNIGVSTAEGASKVGQGFLYEQAQKSTAGQAKIVGHVEDDHGVLWPAWAIRAGDRIVFTDAHDPVARRVVRSQYDDASKANQLDLDSPPENLDSLLARYGAALTGLGVG